MKLALALVWIMPAWGNTINTGAAVNNVTTTSAQIVSWSVGCFPN
jgi:hypothetical protein